ncbi:MAG TPA: SIS domain-containing protein [Deltaproteobacteria bacterium]|nr:SIS domain-containing protein [Deltaproteobacteria bacterium]
MYRLLRSFIKRLKKWKIYVGKDPGGLPEYSIVLFPILKDVLFCGLTGILSVKGASLHAQTQVFEVFSSYTQQITGNSLEKIAEGAISPDDYLCPQVLALFENDLYALKQDPQSMREMLYSSPDDLFEAMVSQMNAFISGQEAVLEKHADDFSTKEIEAMSRSLITLKDIAWGLGEDVLKNLKKILRLSGEDTVLSAQAFEKYARINAVLNGLDRLEVRGRDSCGIQLAVTFKDSRDLQKALTRIKQEGLYEEFLLRSRPGDVWNRSVHVSPGALFFTYKTAQVTGDLGDNTAKLREYLSTDRVLKTVLECSSDSQMYLAHTRWASVGAINEANCHPLNNFSSEGNKDQEWDFSPLSKTYPYYGKGPWTINVVLNGDIDNYALLKDSLEVTSRRIDSRLTTDTKVIPLQIEQYLYDGHDLKEAFRKALIDFEGSHAIAMQSNLEPGKIFLALKGSGQSIYVGLCSNQYVFSSEIYGLVELTREFIKMDGETPRIQGNENTKGQIFILDDKGRAGLEGIQAQYYDGCPVELTGEDIVSAEITTRDIDRGSFPHYLLKEIMDAPHSVRKTMRGKYRLSGRTGVEFNLDDEVFPGRTRQALQNGDIHSITVIGQGTAAVAASAAAQAMAIYLKGKKIVVESRKASDLSGFCLEDDMSGQLIIAITQSGTTTDTNRAVAMAKERGAHLIAIVNRRQSDITGKVDGVFYTSDGRDIEMSVASTKAFYSQITAGYILALFMAKLLGAMAESRIAKELRQLEKVTSLMERVIRKKDSIRLSAWDVVRRKKYWAVVGSGTNKVASDEIRIKLSELCYKTISSDIVEDKKHIDLSSEPLILVCAAGTPEMVLEDIVKDVAIFNAHAASVVVIADEGEARFNSISSSVIPVPATTFPLSVIMNTLAGHIWGYYAACSLDAQSYSFKTFRTRISEVVREHEKKELSLYESLVDGELRRSVADFSSIFNAWKRSGALATMNVETATDIAMLMKYAVGKLPIEDFWDEYGDIRVSSSPLDMLDVSLSRAIEELSRPVDAIRHQAKTVTVGTSRKTEAPGGLLFETLDALKFSVENIPARDGLRLKKLQDAVKSINGYTLYEVRGLDEDGRPVEGSTLKVIEKTGLSLAMVSRAETTGTLMGTKRTIVRTGKVYAGDGKADNASIVIIPLIGSGRIVENLLLMHVEFNEGLNAEQKKDVLGVKFNDISNLINEYNIEWDDSFLEGLPVKFLLGEDVEVIAKQIKDSLP